jgi:hypothetical protein
MKIKKYAADINLTELGTAYLFFFYFSGITHLLLQLTNTSIFYGVSYTYEELFRKPKRKSLTPLTSTGRQQNMVKLAPANSAGVRMLMQALKKGEAKVRAPT